MKNVLRFLAVVLFVATISMVTTSCKKDKCWDCKTNDVTIQEDTTICDDGGVGSGLAASTAVAAFETLGGTCTEQ